MGLNKPIIITSSSVDISGLATKSDMSALTNNVNSVLTEKLKNVGGKKVYTAGNTRVTLFEDISASTNIMGKFFCKYSGVLKLTINANEYDSSYYLKLVKYARDADTMQTQLEDMFFGESTTLPTQISGVGTNAGKIGKSGEEEHYIYVEEGDCLFIVSASTSIRARQRWNAYIDYDIVDVSTL